jgi:predicted metal-binding protein
VREPHVSHACRRGRRGRGRYRTKPKVVPNFAEVHEMLMEVRSFVYAHSNSDGDCDSVLSLESSFFELRRNVSTK